MSLSPEKWIDLLTLYGPMALFVFMVFVLLQVARRAGGLTADQRKVQVFAYGLVWLSIFVLAGMIVIAWWRVNFPEEFVVSGTIRNLRDPELITTYEELYLHKQPVAGLDFEYQWRLISPLRFTGEIELLLQKKPTDAYVLKYKLPIRSEFYKGTVDIEYDQTSNKMTLLHGTYKEEIAPSPTSIPGEGPTASAHTQNSLTPDIVYAAQLPQVKPEDLISALDADDPVIRATARRDLIALGPSATPYVGEALTDPASSYRLKVEALSTLKDMSQPAKQALSEPARCAIARAANEGDPGLRAEATAVVAAGVTIPATCGASQPIPGGLPAVRDPLHLWNHASPGGLAFLPSGMVILDGNGDRLLQVKPSGLAVIPTEGFRDPVDIAAANINGRGFILLMRTRMPNGPSTLTAYTTDGANWKLWSPNEPGLFAAVTADPSNHTVYLEILTPAPSLDIVRLSAQSVLKQDPHPFSLVSAVWGPPQEGCFGHFPSTDRQLGGVIAIDSANERLFLASNAGDVFRIDLSQPNKNPTRLPLHQNLGTPQALAWESGSRTLYVGAGRHLWAVKVDMIPPNVSEFVPSHRFRRVTGLAMDSNHVLWVGDSDARALYLVSASGQIIQSLQ